MNRSVLRAGAPIRGGTALTRARRLLAFLGLMMALGTAPEPARAETSELRIGSGFGIHYLPFYVMEREHLVEKHATALGLPPLKVSYTILSGGASLNDALLSGSVDMVGTGVGPFAILWDKTRGRQNVKAIASMGDIPLVLLTNDPKIMSLRDLKETDRIAVPAVRASMQATLLQMAAAKQFGEARSKDFDRYTVTLPHAEATTALMSSGGIVSLHFSVAPYSTRALASGKVHQISSAAEIVGGPMSFNLVSLTERFHADNPTVSRAFVAALDEAMTVIRTNRPQVARYYLDGNRGATPDTRMVEEVLADPAFDYTIVPHGVGAFVDFMARTGLVRNKPSSWKDLFFPEAQALPGN